MSTARVTSQPRIPPESEEPDDLFVLAYDEAIAAVDEFDAASAALDRLLQSVPADARRAPRALIGITTEDGRPVAAYAHTHEEIDEATEAMRQGSDGGAEIDMYVIDVFAAAVHEALRQDSERIQTAHAVAGLVEARRRYNAASAEAQATRARLATIVPISPEGIVWLSKFLHSEANFGGDIETIAKAARNLVTATGRLVFNRDLHPTLH
ncbi:hypothetical protein [Kaistia terrae]|uniref:Uncharacterized protein n=1 Tax=Kaistia terrae TaxID=537017 RepID=A0ABW0Q8N8_9HYPH|nr:hypothetical protein [Kaistia terrae]MCX5581525.1 hypothetical protein [Kaistia terrae]